MLFRIKAASCAVLVTLIKAKHGSLRHYCSCDATTMRSAGFSISQASRKPLQYPVTSSLKDALVLSFSFLLPSSRAAMLPRLPVYILLFLPLAPVQRSAADSSEKSSASSPHLPPSPLGDPSWALGLRLYQALRADSSSVNTLFSPLLAASSLGALGGGSAGASASQFRDLLKASSSAKAGAELLSESLKSLGKSNGTSFHARASAALFSKEAPQVSQAFVKDSQARFGLQHQPLGKGDSKADLKRLRSWAKVALGGLDGAPLAAEIQAKAGSLILANAFSFKGE